MYKQFENLFTGKHNVLEQLAANATGTDHQDLGVLDRLLQGRLKHTLHLSHDSGQLLCLKMVVWANFNRRGLI